MNQDRLIKLTLILLVAVLAGALGCVTLVDKIVPEVQLQSSGTENIQLTSLKISNNFPATTTLPETTANNPEQKNLNSCFEKNDALVANINKSNWKTFEGYGFAVKYPTDSIAIKLFVSPDNGKISGFGVSSLISPHTASISVHDLRKETFRVRFINDPSVLYELYSNTWWREERYWDSSNPIQCNPNSVGNTDDGKHSIYFTSNGDMGYFRERYSVVLRDTVKESDNYQPLIVEFSTSADLNNQNYSSYPAFKSVLENIIKTLELRPTSKG